MYISAILCDKASSAGGLEIIRAFGDIDPEFSASGSSCRDGGGLQDSIQSILVPEARGLGDRQVRIDGPRVDEDPVVSAFLMQHHHSKIQSVDEQIVHFRHVPSGYGEIGGCSDGSGGNQDSTCFISSFPSIFPPSLHHGPATSVSRHITIHLNGSG